MLINFEDHLDKLELIRTGKLNEAPKIGIEGNSKDIIAKEI